jgi:general secretion pathway protein G
VLHITTADAALLKGRTYGFTLIEMMVVIAIIGALATIVAPTVFRNLGDANVTAARSQIEIIAMALENYRMDTGSYPTTEHGLAALRTRPETALAGWRGPYLRKPVPADPWRRPYVYTSPGTHNADSFDVYTLGRDGVTGGAGEDADITSWGEALER